MERMDEPQGRLLGRRAFLGIVGVGLSSLVWGESALRALDGVTSSLPAGVQSAIPALGGGWRIYAVNPPYPRFEPATWSLRIDGLVRRPVSLTYDQLRALPQARQVADFHCVTGWSVLGVRWAGVRTDDLLAVAGGVQPGARAIDFVSAETPYIDTLTLDQARAADALLAYDMDDEPLTREHGAPARFVMPRMYGYKGVKWVARLRVTDRVTPGYWEQRGYDTDAWVGHSNGLG